MAAAAGSGDAWRISGEDRAKHDSQFFSLKPVNGFVTGDQARGFFMQSGLPTPVLGQIWGLADMNNDGKMDKKEFSIAMHLIKKRLQGYELPKSLPTSLKADPSPMVGSFGAMPAQSGMMGMTPGMGIPPVAMGPAASMAMGQRMPMMANGMPQMVAPTGFMGGGGMPVAGVPVSGGFAGAMPVRPGAPQGGPAGGISLAMPHPSKLKYTQMFNTNDRNKRGSLTGVEARAILVQTGVPQHMLAQIWNLSDVDKDGKLNCDEFCIAMHLTDLVKMGQMLPAKLPSELLPTKARSGSFGTGPLPPNPGPPSNSFGDLVGSMGMPAPVQPVPVANGETKPEEIDMSPVTFEDRRKLNFDKGQAELERRRQQLQEQMRKENEARMEKERQEHEKREKHRLEQERKKQQELERHLEKQREVERQREEQRQKMMEQREAARRELERQRQMEWERQRKEQLMAEKAREYEQLSALKSRSINFKCELESLQGKKTEISTKISQVKNGVTDFTAHIEAMRSTRDLKNQDIERLQREIQEVKQKLSALQSERQSLDLKVQTTVQSNPMSETHRTMMHSVELKKTSVQKLKKDLEQIEKETGTKLMDIDTLNAQLKENSSQLSQVTADVGKVEKQKQADSASEKAEKERIQREKDKHETLRKELESQRLKEESTKSRAPKPPKPAADTSSGGNWFDFGSSTASTSATSGGDNWASVFDSQPATQPANDGWSAAFSSQVTAPTTAETSHFKLSGSKQKYKAMYEFEARNADELTLLPGDVVMVFDDQTGAEPGWKGGDVNGKCGWFPEAYVEKMVEESSQAEPAVLDMTTGITSSEDSSFMAVQVKMPTVSPTPGQGQAAPDGLQAEALYPWKAKKENHLTFNKGDIIHVKEQQDMWWSGDVNGQTGWFPKSYVKLIGGGVSSVAKTDSPIPSIIEDKPSSARASPALAKPSGEMYVGLFAYQSHEPGDLNFNQGDPIMVTKNDGDWWTGSIGDKTGIFPANYVKISEQQLQQAPAEPPTSSANMPFSTNNVLSGDFSASFTEDPFKMAGPESSKASFTSGPYEGAGNDSSPFTEDPFAAASGQSPFPDDPFKASNEDSPFPEEPFKSSSNDSPFPEDPFKATSTESAFSEDPFKATSTESSFSEDPFKATSTESAFTEDPFKATSTESAFSEDPFKATSTESTFSEDPFKATSTESAFLEDPFKASGDPFKATVDQGPQSDDPFGNTGKSLAADTLQLDPFASFDSLGSSVLTTANPVQGLNQSNADSSKDINTNINAFPDQSVDWFQSVEQDATTSLTHGFGSLTRKNPETLTQTTGNLDISSQTSDSIMNLGNLGTSNLSSLEALTSDVINSPEECQKGPEVKPSAGSKSEKPKPERPPLPRKKSRGSSLNKPGLDPTGPLEDIVDESDPRASSALSQTGTLKRPEIATVIAAYTATGQEQLSLSPGQLIQVRKKSPSGWWEGELQARGQKRKIGWFPANYVKLLGGSARSTPDNTLIAAGKTSPVPVSLGAASSANPSPAPPTSSTPQPSTAYVDHVIALYPYNAQHADELTFQKDAVINVIKKDDPDWWQGEYNGATGMFPSNYVQNTTPESNSWSEDPQVLAVTSAEESKRQSTIHELINTEERYMQDMSIVLEAFYKPLQEGGALTEDELQAIFVNWKDLIVCNTKLQKALRVRKKMCGVGQVINSIGDILCENIPHLTAYIRFCSCQLNAAALLQKLTETNSKFTEIHKKCVQNPKTKGMPLSSFLLKPMQRITKYPLLVEKIIKHTPESHPDHTHLLEALETCQVLCSQVNEGVREKENSDRLEWIQQRVHCEGLPEKITFNSVTNCLGPRKLVHTGVVYKIKSNKELAAFLFNDFLLLTTSNRSLTNATHSVFDLTGQVQYKMYKTPVFLNEVMIRDASSEDTELFTINHIEHVYNLKCHNQLERDTWVRHLKTANRHYLDTEKKKREKAISLRHSPGMGRLLVVILEGVDLQAKDVNGKSDPYCEVSMGSQEHKTKVINATLNPKWNASMQFTIRDVDMDALCITVFDRDLFSPNDFLGRTEIRVKDILKETGTAQGRKPITKTLLLHEVPTGEVIVKLDLHLFDQS